MTLAAGMGCQCGLGQENAELRAKVVRLEKALADEIEMFGDAMTIVHLKAFEEGREKGREEALLNSLKEGRSDG